MVGPMPVEQPIEPLSPSHQPATITLSLGLNNFARAGAQADWRSLLDQARAAEAAGIDRIVVVDHVVMGEHLDAYDGGTFPTGSDGDWLEPLTVLAAIAAATTRIRLATGIVIAALRPAALLAKTTATLDVLSGGRLDLGVGIGWQREEYDAVGLDFDRRGELLDDTLRTCRALWTGQPVALPEPTWCRPMPVQPGGVPIWISGRMHPRTMRRIVELGDGWIPWVAGPGAVAEGIRQIRVALAEAGRDATGFRVRSHLRVRLDGSDRPDLVATMDAVPQLVAEGVTDLQLAVPPAARSAVADELAEIVDAFRARVAEFGGAEVGA